MEVLARWSRSARAFVLLGTLVLAASPAGRAQTIGRIERDRGLAMLRLVREDVEKHYYDPTFRGVDLAARFGEAEAKVQAATTQAEVLAAIADALFVLDDSHTFFVPPGLTIHVDYGWEMQFYGDSCFVSEVRPKSDAEQKGLKPGDRVLSLNGIRPTRENLWKIAYIFNLLRPQRSLRVAVQSPGAAPRQLDLEARARERYRILDLTTSDIWTLIRDRQTDAERYRPRYVTSGNDLLIWKLPVFSLDAVTDGAKRMKDRSAVILDLRGNEGGSVVSLLDLLGRFFSDDVTVGTQAERSRKEPMVARGKGKGAFAGKVVVLVDSRSYSAAEIFARTMQLQGRARLVGDRTGGLVMRSRTYSHTSGTQTVFVYAASVTDADVVMSDGSRLEKVGVVPDVPLVPTSGDLAANRDPVLAHAAGLVGLELTPEKAWALLHED